MRAGDGAQLPVMCSWLLCPVDLNSHFRVLSRLKVVYCLLSVGIFHHLGKMQDGNMENSQNKGNLLSYSGGCGLCC